MHVKYACDSSSTTYKLSIQWWGSELIESGFTKFDEFGSGSKSIELTNWFQNIV